MRTKWKKRPGLLALAILICCGYAAALDETVTDPDYRGTDFRTIEVNTYFEGTTGTVTGSGGIDGRVIINDTHALFNDIVPGAGDPGLLFTNAGGGGGRGFLVVEGGGQFVNGGVLTFGTDAASGSVGGGLVVDAGGTVVLSETTYFLAGSTFAGGGAGTGAVQIMGNVLIDTGMDGNSARALLDASALDSATGYLTIQGAASRIGGTIDFTGKSWIGSRIYISTNAGDAYSHILAGNAELHFVSTTVVDGAASATGHMSISDESTVTFKGNTSVAADGTRQYFDVAEKSKAVFDGAAAEFSSGNVRNGGTIEFVNGGTFSAGSAVGTGGAVQNQGTITFDDTAHYTAGATGGVISNLNGGVINIGTGMADAEIKDMFGNIQQAAGGKVVLTGTDGVGQNLTLGASATGSTVQIKDGGSFQGMNVNNSSLVIDGAGANTVFAGDVVANDIDVNLSQQTTFQADVKGDLTVRTNAVLDTGATFKSDSITVYSKTAKLTNKGEIEIVNGEKLTNNGLFTNDGVTKILAGGELLNTTADSRIVNTGTITNDGSSTNDGVFTNQGVYDGTGSFTNNLTFKNEGGTFKNQTTAPGMITNKGTMEFDASTTYQNSAAGNYVYNEGTVTANAYMNKTQLQNLMKDLSMRQGSVFNLVAGSAGTITGDFEFGQTVASATDAPLVNFDFNGEVKFGDGATDANFDAGNADIHLKQGTVNLQGGSSVMTAGKFTTAEKTKVVFGSTTSTELSAGTAEFSRDSVVQVVENGLGIISITGAGASDGLYFKDTASVDIAKNGVLTVNGATRTTTFDTGTSLTLGENAKMNLAGDLAFNVDSTINVTATGTSMSRVTAGGEITITGKNTNVFFTGDRIDIIAKAGEEASKMFLVSDSGTIVGKDNLYNALYKFDTYVDGGSLGVYVSGMRSVLDSMNNALGGEGISINKVNGGHYTDNVLATDWGMNNPDLIEYLQLAGDPNNPWDTSFNAYSQLFGEYAAYSSTSTLNATRNFADTLKSRMGHTRLARVDDCNVCYGAVLEDPCNACGDIVVASSGIVGGGSGLWGGVFGDWGTQKGKKYINGYDYNATGVVVGYDHTIDRLTVGVAGSYTNGTLKVDRQSTKFNSDAINFALYGMYAHESNMYVAGQLGYGYGWNDYKTNMVLGGTKDGDYKNHSYTASLEIGYNAMVGDGISIVPHVGLDYIHVGQKGWTEGIGRSGAAPIVGNSYERLKYNSVEIPVGVNINKVIQMGELRLVPEGRAAFVYEADDRRPFIRTAYTGANSGWATMYGADTGSTRGVLGAGIKALYSNNFSLGVDYTFEFKGGYREHNVAGTMCLDF